MSKQMYFVNDTKKQIVASKKLYGDFEDKQQLLCYLNLCQGDNFRTLFDNSEFIEDFLHDGENQEYKYINLFEFDININTDISASDEFDRMYEIVNRK